MYKKILLPVDGSEISSLAANAGVTFARQVGAEIVAIYVTQPVSALLGFDGMAAAISESNYEDAAKQEAEAFLKPVLERADAADVKASSVIVSNHNVAEGIVETAKKQGCDLIFIATHGRSGLSRFLLGSVTTKVISLASSSVFVYRAGGQGN
ncbi:universal stress protein [Pelistega sp. NLN82]|uniref:Universal stress protein n=1 Tax=Pelistega ratti TaxID=2652177 RepID=A0A6L9Y4S9_9BURK|nr:universal stress protein [Pelistega ratti]NEN74794.1 universal stress protein [Pelistega ratti]